MAWGVAFLLLLVWLAMSFTAPSRQSHSGFAVLINRFRYGAPYYFGQFNAHVFPLPMLLTLGLLWLRGAISDAGERVAARHAAVLLAMVAVGGICGAMLSPFRFFRYAVPVLPLVLALGAIGLSALGAGGRLRQSVAAAIVVAIATSTAPFVWSHALMASMARTERRCERASSHSSSIACRSRSLLENSATLREDLLQQPSSTCAIMRARMTSW